MTPTRRRYFFSLKLLFALLIIGAVGRYFAKLMESPEWSARDVYFDIPYLLLSGLLYLGAHTIWGTFFFQLLRFEGAAVSWPIALRAYFVSQLGKYVPGKAWVILMRIGLLRPQKVPAAIVAVCGTYETLTTMAAGAVLGVCLFPWLGLSELGALDGNARVQFAFGSWEWVMLLAVAALPISLGILNRRITKNIQARRGPDAVPLPSPSLMLLLRGLLQAMLGWALLGLSLWCMVNAVLPLPLRGEVFAEAVAAVAVSYVAGFLAFLIPGGLGVRELILQRVLMAQLVAISAAAQPLSALIAITLRLVWTLFEVLVSVGWYALGRRYLREMPISETT